jgi:hypothetical protein
VRVFDKSSARPGEKGRLREAFKTEVSRELQVRCAFPNARVTYLTEARSRGTVDAGLPRAMQAPHHCHRQGGGRSNGLLCNFACVDRTRCEQCHVLNDFTNNHYFLLLTIELCD